MNIRLISIIGFILFSTISSFGQSLEGFYEENGNIYYNDNIVTNIEYQQNADIIRLRHLDYYGRLILEYYEKVGHYPLQNVSENPIYVYIANRSQISFTEAYENAIPYEHKTILFKDLIEEIEQELGFEIEEYYDPQEYPDAKWNWYLYSVNKDTFYFAVNVHQKFPFSKFISPYSYKIEISNTSNRSANLIIETNELLNSEHFLQERNRSVKNEKYFNEIENKYLHDTKNEYL